VVAFAPKVIKCAYGAIKGNKMRRLRRRTREGCGFSSLMKQKIKAKIYFVICFAGKKKLLFYIYAVIVKQNFYKRSSNYYLCIYHSSDKGDLFRSLELRPKKVPFIAHIISQCVYIVVWGGGYMSHTYHITVCVYTIVLGTQTSCLRRRIHVISQCVYIP
jgi:hypothetical protein